MLNGSHQAGPGFFHSNNRTCHVPSSLPARSPLLLGVRKERQAWKLPSQPRVCGALSWPQLSTSDRRSAEVQDQGRLMSCNQFFPWRLPKSEKPTQERWDIRREKKDPWQFTPQHAGRRGSQQGPSPARTQKKTRCRKPRACRAHTSRPIAWLHIETRVGQASGVGPRIPGSHTLSQTFLSQPLSPTGNLDVPKALGGRGRGSPSNEPCSLLGSHRRIAPLDSEGSSNSNFPTCHRNNEKAFLNEKAFSELMEAHEFTKGPPVGPLLPRARAR